MDPAQSRIKQVQIEATVIRSDGRVEELGIVSDSIWGRWDPRRLLASKRIREANERSAS